MILQQIDIAIKINIAQIIFPFARQAFSDCLYAIFILPQLAPIRFDLLKRRIIFLIIFPDKFKLLRTGAILGKRMNSK
ncbi:hypothetical protein DXN04_16060 [Chitinophaga silvisoli]|uniref:Uncharacterized protein n=1 Tax=Chitinophaga silvisoli TaxID=2291814 RepID=A0A3E1P033_9BACT|nr:hypothetical protein DXN04_16060 [Chitinophaga silvisoli]